MKTPQYYLEAVISDNFDDVRLLKDYSGRGMFGKLCVGIVGSTGACREALAAAMALAAIDSRNVQMGSSREETDDYMLQMFELLMNYHSDNMGTGMVMYWPRIQAMDEVS